MEEYNKHKFAQQPAYYTLPEKIKARDQIVKAYRSITGRNSIPDGKGYWTLCNKQPNAEGSEIVQLTNCGLLKKSQFFGVDNDIKKEGIIEFNKSQHPEAHWFEGDWLRVLDDNYDVFNPALVFFDFTKTVGSTKGHLLLADTMEMCPAGTVIAANLMLSDGHSKREFDAHGFPGNVSTHLSSPEEWSYVDKFYPYKASHTDMGTYIFKKEDN